MMASLKLGKDQGADYMLSKEKMKDGSKVVLSKSTKKQLPLPPLHHPYQAAAASSPALPSVITASSSISSTSSSSAIPATSLPFSSSSSTIPFLMGPSSSSSTAILSASTLSPTALLREILNNIATQRNQIIGLMNNIDPGFLASTHPKSLQEHRLLNQVAELQGKILDTNEEIHLMRAKNAQLEQQLSLFQGKR